MQVRETMELASTKDADEIRAEAAACCGLVVVRLQLTLAGWNLAETVRDYGNRPVAVRSSDGLLFLGEVSEVDEGRYTVTVDLDLS